MPAFAFSRMPRLRNLLLQMCSWWCWAARRWCTVTKVGNGFNDDRVASLQKEMLPLMDKIKGDSDR